MASQQEIKNKFERNQKALTLKPSLGLGTGISTTRLVNGLFCEIKEGNWTLKTDMSNSVGGTSNAPSAGVYGRAALGSCLATGYMMWASKLDIVLESLEIEVQADYDDGALFGSSDVPAGYSAVRYLVRIKSPNSAEEIEDFLNTADQHSPYLDVFSRPQFCTREVELLA